MPRVITVAVLSAALSAAGTAAVLLQWDVSRAKRDPGASLAVVDLAGIVERQRAAVIRAAKDPESAELMMAERLVRLASVLAEAGQTRLILNKPAVVSGTLGDLTGEIEERLKREGSDAREPSR
ncbi:MAG: TrbI F-type domain-containing protein [Nitrospirota bacterium]